MNWIFTSRTQLLRSITILSFQFKLTLNILWGESKSIQIHIHELKRSQLFNNDFCNIPLFYQIIQTVVHIHLLITITMTLNEQCLLIFTQQKHIWVIKWYIICLHFFPTPTCIFLSFFLSLFFYDSQLYFHDSGIIMSFRLFSQDCWWLVAVQSTACFFFYHSTVKHH